MKNIKIILLFSLVFSNFSSFGVVQKNTFKSGELSKSTKKNKNIRYSKQLLKNTEFSLSYEKINLKEIDYNSLTEANGINLKIGKKYKLFSFVDTTSFFTSSFAKYKALEDSSTFLFDIGFSQKISLNFLLDDRPLSFFLSFGYSFGRLNSIEKFYNQNRGNQQLTINVNYTKPKIGTGFEFAFSKSFIPFVKYELSKIIFSNIIQIKREDSRGLKIEKIITDKSLTIFNIQTYSAGFRYLF